MIKWTGENQSATKLIKEINELCDERKSVENYEQSLDYYIEEIQMDLDKIAKS